MVHCKLASNIFKDGMFCLVQFLTNKLLNYLMAPPMRRPEEDRDSGAQMCFKTHKGIVIGDVNVMFLKFLR